MPVLLLGLLVLTGCQHRPIEFQRVHWSGEIKPEHNLEFTNPLGDVHIRQGSEGFVGVDLVGQCADAEPAVQATEADVGRLSLVVAGEGCLRVDVSLFVGPGVQLTVESDAGHIVAKRLRNPIEAHSQSGDISLTAAGVLSATTGSGALRISPMARKWREPMIFRSETGAIVLGIPPEHVVVTACTSGTIESELPISSSKVQAGVTCVTTHSGRGLFSIQASSESGSIGLFRQ